MPRPHSDCQAVALGRGAVLEGGAALSAPVASVGALVAATPAATAGDKLTACPTAGGGGCTGSDTGGDTRGECGWEKAGTGGSVSSMVYRLVEEALGAAVFTPPVLTLD